MTCWTYYCLGQDTEATGRQPREDPGNPDWANLRKALDDVLEAWLPLEFREWEYAVGSSISLVQLHRLLHHVGFSAEDLAEVLSVAVFDIFLDPFGEAYPAVASWSEDDD